MVRPLRLIPSSTRPSAPSSAVVVEDVARRLKVEEPLLEDLAAVAAQPPVDQARWYRSEAAVAS